MGNKFVRPPPVTKKRVKHEWAIIVGLERPGTRRRIDAASQGSDTGVSKTVIGQKKVKALLNTFPKNHTKAGDVD